MHIHILKINCIFHVRKSNNSILHTYLWNAWEGKSRCRTHGGAAVGAAAITAIHRIVDCLSL